MLGKFLDAVVSALGRGKYRATIDRRSDGFVLQTFRGRKTIPFFKVADKLEPLSPLVQYRRRPDGSILLPPDKLDEAKAILRGAASDALDVVISPAVDVLRLVETPAGFHVKYVWAPERACIEPRMAEGAAPIDDGWFVNQDRYWHIAGTTPEDDLWLSRPAIEGADMITLTGRIASGWQERGLPYACEVRCEEAPAFNLIVAQVAAEAVEFEVRWRVPVSSVAEVPSLPGYVMAAGALMHGLAPKTLLRSLPVGTGAFRLTAQDIPRFVKHAWPGLQTFATGRVEEFCRAHRTLDATGELILVVRREERDGLGAAVAVPVLRWGDLRIDAEEVSRQLDASAEYIRAGGVWLPKTVALTAGLGPLGRWNDGTLLAPLPLLPVEILQRGSERLAGPWSTVEFPAIELPQGRSRADAAVQHLDFLVKWRIPGGVIGTSEDIHRAFVETFARIAEDHPEARILVVGAKKTLAAVDTSWPSATTRLDGGKRDAEFRPRQRGVVVATPRALETAPGLLRAEWTILCLLEADALVRSGASKLFANLVECRKNLVVGSFSSRDFLRHPAVREALSQVFGIAGQDGGAVIWRCGLRDPADVGPGLPPPYPLHRKSARPAEGIGPAEITLDHGPALGGLAIPPRAPMRPPPTAPQKRQAGKIDLVDLSMRVEVRVTPGWTKFVQDARRLAGRREKRAQFVPFMCYWPTYDSMTPAQLKWYFYWRGEVKEGRYPDTDLSYVFVHIYELINNVGVSGALDGYDQLRRLWLSYRARYPKLDNYLIDWITDYVAVNKCSIDPMTAHVEALALDAPIREPDRLVGSFLATSLARMPLNLIEALCDYRVRRSKFYLEGNQETLGKAVPQVLERVNARMVKKVGQGIFDLFKPRATEPVQHVLYQSAVYGGPAIPVVMQTVIPYSKHAPLREFLTALVKHTENRLRELKGYGGKLRGYALDPSIQATIDEFFDGVAKAAPQPERPLVVIDMARVQDLTKESDQVRDILLVASEEPAPTPRPAAEPGSVGQPAISRPAGTPARLLTDLEPAGELLGRLGGDERLLVETIVKAGWEAGDDILRTALSGVLIEPLIDRINEAALELLGDILIASEGGQKVISDDLRDELEYLFSLVAARAERVSADNADADLPPEWAAFASALADYQLDALRALLEHPDPTPALRQIADAVATMPDLLVDAINELALDNIGDHIVEPGSSPPVIEEEDLEMTRKIVAARTIISSR